MSKGLIYLKYTDFFRQELPQGKYEVVNKLQGLSVVLFYSKKCQFCAPVIEVFKNLTGKIMGVNFAIANITADNMAINKIFMGSVTPIQHVPYIVVYMDGKFYLEYRGPRDVPSILRASAEIEQKIKQGKDFNQGQVCTTSKNGVQGYCVEGYEEDEDVCFSYDEVFGSGKVCDSRTGKCYFTYDEAYGK